MTVYELHKGFYFAGTWRGSGGSSGTLYATLISAQLALGRDADWKKRKGQQAWETDHCDLIFKRQVKP